MMRSLSLDKLIKTGTWCLHCMLMWCALLLWDARTQRKFAWSSNLLKCPLLCIWVHKAKQLWVAVQSVISSTALQPSLLFMASRECWSYKAEKLYFSTSTWIGSLQYSDHNQYRWITVTLAFIIFRTKASFSLVGRDDGHPICTECIMSGPSLYCKQRFWMRACFENHEGFAINSQLLKEMVCI